MYKPLEQCFPNFFGHGTLFVMKKCHGPPGAGLGALFFGGGEGDSKKFRAKKLVFSEILHSKNN